jgi:hypothetical protein
LTLKHPAAAAAAAAALLLLLHLLVFPSLCCCYAVQSVATFTATGPTTNGKSVYTNCAESVKSGWFTKAAANKEINKATDTWMPGDCE